MGGRKMKNSLCLATIMIIIFLGLLSFNTYIAEAEEGKASTKESSTESLKQFVGQVVYFKHRSSSLDPAAKDILKKQADWLMKNPDISVIIEGHGDEYKNAEKNLLLGELRAGSVKSYLIRLGIEAARLTTVSYGAARKVTSRRDKKSKAKNWRVSFAIKIK